MQVRVHHIKSESESNLCQLSFLRNLQVTHILSSHSPQTQILSNPPSAPWKGRSLKLAEKQRRSQWIRETSRVFGSLWLRLLRLDDRHTMHKGIGLMQCQGIWTSRCNRVQLWGNMVGIRREHTNEAVPINATSQSRGSVRSRSSCSPIFQKGRLERKNHRVSIFLSLFLRA